MADAIVAAFLFGLLIVSVGPGAMFKPHGSLGPPLVVSSCP